MNSADMDNNKIMLVDDEENILLSLSFLLEKEGYEVASAMNGNEALKLYKSFKPNIILLDVMMPEMDGFETANKIRALDHKSETKIIFLTAKGTTNDRRIGYLSGADDYVVKPFENQTILDKIQEKVI